LAPLILAYYILNDGDEFMAQLEGLDHLARSLALDELASRVILPYTIMTVILVVLGLMIKYSPLPDIETEQEEIRDGSEASRKTIFQFPNLVLGVLALFLYVGAEVIAGDTIIRYGISLNIPISTAKLFTSFTLASMVLGYIIGIFLIPKYLSQQKALEISAILGITFTVIAIYSPPMISVTFIALLGLANALVWPAIWPLAIQGLGRFLKTGSAMLIMAIAGGAIMPLIWGKLADIYNTQVAYWILVPSYLIIFMYASSWHKKTKW
jgi:glucose/galactose transporter